MRPLAARSCVPVVLMHMRGEPRTMQQLAQYDAVVEDVGRELRLDSRASPYLRPDADAACCHDLEAYIHLVDGFLGSHCPFRDNAKRSILRLVKNQGGNVKQLYMSKAKDMRIQLDGGGAADMAGSMLGRVDMPGAASTVVECVH